MTVRAASWAAPWMAGSSPAMTVKGLIEKEIVMPGLDPGIHVREPDVRVSGIMCKSRDQGLPA
jgi:hypothetical protein